MSNSEKPQLGLFDSRTLGVPNPSRLDAIRADMEKCSKCQIYMNSSQKMFGSGHQDRPTIAFLSEMPNIHEITSGIQFQGEVGALLKRLLERMGFVREECFVAPIVACCSRQPRPPEPNEMSNCKPFLFGQLQAVRPKVIVALGSWVGNHMLQNNVPKSLEKLRSSWHDWQGIPLRVSFSLIHLVKQPLDREYAWQDYQAVLDLLHSTG